MEFYCRVFFKIISKKGILIILCLWSSTVAHKEIFFLNLHYWGSIVGGVLRDKEMGHIVGNAAMTLFGAPSSG
jgi:hypothetical protein